LYTVGRIRSSYADGPVRQERENPLEAQVVPL
jgi:hypothetical protein